MCHRLYDSESNNMNVVVFHIPSGTREDCIFVFASKVVFFTLSEPLVPFCTNCPNFTPL